MGMQRLLESIGKLITFRPNTKTMRVKRISIFFLTAALMAVIPARAQEGLSYKPSDKWPYLLEDFTEGVIRMKSGELPATLNICAADGHVHYLEDGIILEATAADILGAEAGGRSFVKAGGLLMEVAAENGNGAVLIDRTVNLGGSEGVDIGFGIVSSNMGTSVDMSSTPSLGTSFIHAKVAEKALDKEVGITLSIDERYMLLKGGSLVAAQKKDVQEIVGKDRMNALMKTEKIKWNRPESLLKVIDMLADFDF